MNDRTLKSFLTVADCGSFSKAEEESYLSKQALIRQIDTLEAELRSNLNANGLQEILDARSAYYDSVK